MITGRNQQNEEQRGAFIARRKPHAVLANMSTGFSKDGTSALTGVSAPLSWKEVHDRPGPQEITIDTIAAQVSRIGDRWAKHRTQAGNDLLAAIFPSKTAAWMW